MRRQMSEATRALLDRLQRSGDSTGVLIRLGLSGDALALPSIFHKLVGADDGVRTAATIAIHRLLAPVPPHDLVYLDQVMRSVSPWWYGSSARSAVLQTLELLDPAVESTVFVLGLASFHSDGYVREAAVRRLADGATGQEIPFLLIRANDWVPQVRTRASAALRERIDSNRAAHFLPALVLVQHLGNWRRVDHGPLVAAVVGELGSGRHDGALVDAILTSDRRTARACARIAATHGRDEVCAAARSHPDSITRAIGLQHLLTRRPELAAELMSDSFVRIRQLALRTLITRDPDEVSAWFEAGLLDSSRWIRQIASFYVKQRSDMDLAEFYRTRLGDGTAKPSVCVLGLGEHGEPGDVARLIELVDCGSPRVRRAAITAIAQLDLDGQLDLVKRALAADLPGVSKAASVALDRRADLAEYCEDLLRRAEPVHVRRNALRLLQGFGKWWQLKSALIAASQDPELVRLGSLAVDRWIWNFNRSYVRPAAAQLEAIHGLLASPDLKLARERVDWLRGYVPKVP